MNGKILIYTAITGGYDSLRQPALAPDDFDFLCFVAKGTKRADYEGVWRIEELPLDWDDMLLLSRCPKMNPHTMLPEGYEYSLWMDGNLVITGPQIFERCREMRDADVHYAGVHHPFRDCVYEEASAIVSAGRAPLGQVLRAITFLRRHHLPEHAGLMENNLIFRRHNAPEVVEFDRWWWECFLKFPKRDQLTHTFAMKDTPGFEASYIFPKGTSARNCEGLEYLLHPTRYVRRIVRKFRYFIYDVESAIVRSYVKISGWIWSE